MTLLWCRLAPVALFLTATAAAATTGKVCDPRTFGAKADGRTKDTAALQAAIDQCATHSGTVRVSPGTYLIAPISLKSHVTLELAKGATLLGSPDFADYPITGENIWQGQPQPRAAALINATGQTDIKLTGEGTVDGDGEHWWTAYKARKAATKEEMPRPWMVQFSDCDRVTVEGVTLQNSPSYTLVPYFCRNVTIRKIKILAPPETPNTDGIAPYSSHDVEITDCLIDAGDDNIAIKSSRPSGAKDSTCSNITISRCTFLHGHGATIGADTGGGVHDVLFDHVRLQGTRYGLRIKAGRGFGGEVHHIVYRDIELIDTNPAITVSEYYPNVPAAQDEAKPVTATTPQFHDITFTRVTAKGGSDAGQIVGLPESPVRGLLFEDVSISSSKGLQIRNATVTLRNSKIQATSGPPLIAEDNAHVNQQ